MRYPIAVASGILALCAGNGWSTAASHPPIDRPSPPPCCADGVCYPNGTWGVYPTRWRRWPTEPSAALEPTPERPQPRDLGPDVPPYQTPTPEEEDRRAPPPTRRPEGVEAAEEGDDVAPGATPTSPTTPTTPPVGPVPDGSGGPRSLQGPMESAPSMPWDEPTSSNDPPPAPPFAARQASQTNAPARPAPNQATGPRVPVLRPADASADPPPALPLALSNNS